MDRNGYNDSIMYSGRHCAVCERTGDLQRHEVFHGAYRQKSKKYGLWITVCPECHRLIHNSDGTLDRHLKEWAQRQAMTVYHWDVNRFRREFGKNYLEDA